MQDIKDMYQEKYGNSLADDVASDTSGDYRQLLTLIISGVPEATVNGEEAEGEAEAAGNEGDAEDE